jgi:hypothetical protein
MMASLRKYRLNVTFTTSENLQLEKAHDCDLTTDPSVAGESRCKLISG